MSECLIEKAMAEFRSSGVMKPKTLHPRILPRKPAPAGRLPMERTFRLMEGRP